MAQASRGAQGIEFFTHVENGKRNAKLSAFCIAVDRQISNNVDRTEQFARQISGHTWIRGNIFFASGLQLYASGVGA